MFDINDSYQLIYNCSSGVNITFSDSLLQKLNENDLSGLPANISVFLGGIEFFELELIDTAKLKIFRFPVECKIKDLNKPIKIISFEHLKIILQKKFKENVYKIPYYYSNFLGKDVYINIDEIEKTSIYLDKYIEIKEKEEKNFRTINSLFNALNSIYQEKNIKKYSYQFISPNFQFYFSNLTINLTDEFNFIYAKNRIGLKQKVTQFLEENDSSFLYPICGPYGTGKTISILTFHKLLFIDNIRGLYLNLKYYLKDGITLEKKIEALLNECFYICDNEKELLSLYDKFITKKNIYELFIIINDFIQSKNERINENNKNNEKYNKIYIMIDQYQEMYNMSSLFDLFKNIKIVLLSSINDFDVKSNLILKYKDEIQKEFNKIEDENIKSKVIKYKYIEELIDNNFYENKIFQKLIKNKIRKKKK